MDWNTEFNIDIKQVAKEVRQIREEKKVIYDDYGKAVPKEKLLPGVKRQTLLTSRNNLFTTCYIYRNAPPRRKLFSRKTHPAIRVGKRPGVHP